MLVDARHPSPDNVPPPPARACPLTICPSAHTHPCITYVACRYDPIAPDAPVETVIEESCLFTGNTLPLTTPPHTHTHTHTHAS